MIGYACRSSRFRRHNLLHEKRDATATSMNPLRLLRRRLRANDARHLSGDIVWRQGFQRHVQLRNVIQRVQKVTYRRSSCDLVVPEGHNQGPSTFAGHRR